MAQGYATAAEQSERSIHPRYGGVPVPFMTDERYHHTLPTKMMEPQSL